MSDLARVDIGPQFGIESKVITPYSLTTVDTARPCRGHFMEMASQYFEVNALAGNEDPIASKNLKFCFGSLFPALIN